MQSRLPLWRKCTSRHGKKIRSEYAFDGVPFPSIIFAISKKMLKDVSVPGNIGLQMPDCLLLLSDHPVHQVTDRYHTDNHITLHDGKVPETVLRHHAHAITYRVLWRNRDDRTAHDLSYRCLF